MNYNQKLLEEIIRSPDQVERIYKGLVLINTDLAGKPTDLHFDIDALTIDEKKKEIIKVYSRNGNQNIQTGLY